MAFFNDIVCQICYRFYTKERWNKHLYDYDYNNEGLDYSVRGWEIFPEIGELKKLLDILRSK